MSEAVISDRILNLDKTDYEKPSLFMGERLGLLDSLNVHYPQLYKLYKDMKAKDWDELEFKFGSSTLNSEFKTCPKNNYDIMIRTLAWQWEADSVAAKSILAIIAPFATNSELFYGWQRIADSECLTGDHEILTPKGWKRIDHITIDDQVAQWDYKTRSISFINPYRIISKMNDGKLFYFTDGNNNLSQITTPKHRMPIIYPYWEGKNPPQCKFAEDVKYHGGNGLPTAGYIQQGGRRMSAQERLYVAVQADGSLCSEAYNGNYTGYKHYRFSFSKQRKIDRLYELCHYSNWRIQELNTARTAAGLRTFIVFVPAAEYNIKAKTFDWFDFDQISYEWAVDFLDEIKHWDGNITSNGSVRYISTNKACVDKVSTIAHLVGLRGHITVIPPRIGVLMPGGHLSNTKEAYQVYISERPFITGNSITKSVIEVDCNVYCLSVPTGYFLVRHNDIISVTGNCTHALTYSEIVKNSFDNPEEVLKDILKIKEAFSRLEIVGEIFNNALITGSKLNLGLVERNQDTYNDVFMFVVALYCLEAIQFMSSFGITFAMGNAQEFIPIAMAVQKIANDEYYVHRPWDRAVLDIELGNEYGLTAFNKNRAKILDLINSVVRSEMSWNDYTFSEGREHPGLNKDVLNKGVLFYAKEVYEFFGFTKEEIPFELPNKNPLLYMNDWLEIDKMQTSPMEQKSGNYVLGMIAKDSSENEVLDIELD